MTSVLAVKPRLVEIRRPVLDDKEQFLEMTRCSRSLHHPWVNPPLTEKHFLAYLKSRETEQEDAFLVTNAADGSIMGVINLSMITWGALESAYISYYANKQYCHQGFMKQGLLKVAKFCFEHIGLHRLEANIQPHNIPSKKLVKSCGFCYEGFSLKLIKVKGRWRDHERWSLLNPNHL